MKEKDTIQFKAKETKSCMNQTKQIQNIEKTERKNREKFVGHGRYNSYNF